MVSPPNIAVQPATSTAAPSVPAVAASAFVHVTLLSLVFASGWTNRADLVMQQGEAVSQSRESISLEVSYRAPTTVARLELVDAPPPTTELSEREELLEVAAEYDVAKSELGELPPIEIVRPEMKPRGERRPRPAKRKPPQDRPPQEPTPSPQRLKTPPLQQRPPGTEHVGAAMDSLPTALASNQPPSFPAEAIAERRGGVVLLKVHIDAEGVATRVGLLQSSGHHDLDQAALTAVRKWRFTPATRDGHPVAYEVAVPIRFVIDRR